LMTDTTTYRYYRYRTNVADSRNIGFEGYAEADILRLLGKKSAQSRVAVFNNIAWIDARDGHSKEGAFDGKWVELVPNINFKKGVSVQHKHFKGSLQWTYVTGQYSDATNAETSPNAVEGYIPAYNVLDCSASYACR